MLSWIVAAIALYYIGLFIPSGLKVSIKGVAWGFGPQDDQPADTLYLGRARRAHENIKENLPVFLAVATLTIVTGTSDAALTGAMIWVIARALFLPLYLVGVPWLRTLAFGFSLIGLVVMSVALVSGAGSTA